jgi:hypothetical protein
MPRTIGLLVQLVESCTSSPSASSTDTPLLLQRFRFIALLSFFAFLRFSDFFCSSCASFFIFPDYMTIFIPHSKCDQYRKGNTVSAAVNSKSPTLRPVNAARIYVALLRHASATEDNLVLQPVLIGRDGHLFLGHAASRSVLGAQLRRAFHCSVANPAQYPLHSF